MIKTILRSTLLALLFVSPAIAQQKASSIIIGDKLTIDSKILRETRHLMINAPEKLSQKVPLVLVFDAESLFETTVAAVRFMNYSSEIPQMPEAVVVGILNKNRDRDMPTPQQYGNLNGERNFMNFLKEELVPWLNKRYRLNGHTITIGHSQGGLFVSYLLSESPDTFPWAVALDSPLNVSPNSNKLKETLIKTIGRKESKIRYASIESVFGWGKEWGRFVDQNKEIMQIKLNDESHESMPFKGIYDGLGFLFNDFAPKRRDLSLAELKDHFKLVSADYGHHYEIPLRVLTASASRKIIENRKEEILELVDYAEAKHGAGDRTAKLKADASKIAKQANPIIDSMLALPPPTEEQISRFKGRWVGQLVVPRGQNMALDMEVTVEGGKVRLFTVNPFNPAKKDEAEILSITNEGKLLFGRRNQGGGLFISTCTIDSKGQLIGEQRLIGFTIPDDESADFKEVMNFTIKNPNTFSLIKQ